MKNLLIVLCVLALAVGVAFGADRRIPLGYKGDKSVFEIPPMAGVELTGDWVNACNEPECDDECDSWCVDNRNEEQDQHWFLGEDTCLCQCRDDYMVMLVDDECGDTEPQGLTNEPDPTGDQSQVVDLNEDIVTDDPDPFRPIHACTPGECAASLEAICEAIDPCRWWDIWCDNVPLTIDIDLASGECSGVCDGNRGNSRKTATVACER